MTGSDPLMGMVPSEANPSLRRVRFTRATSARFTEPFFDDSMDKLPVGPLDRAELSYAELRALVNGQAPASRGLILHTGRCGSTLLTRMLAHDRRTLVLAEPSAIGAVHGDALMAPEHRAENEQVIADLAVVFDRFAESRGQRAVLKLSSWGAADCDRMLDVFPDVPVVFVHRPVPDVVASELHGAPTWSGWLFRTTALGGAPAPHDEAPPSDEMTAGRYAQVWATIVSAALAAPAERMLFVSYADLVDRPADALRQVADHLSIDESWNRSRAESELRYYAKSKDPAEQFDASERHARQPLAADVLEQVMEIVGDLPGRLAERQ